MPLAPLLCYLQQVQLCICMCLQGRGVCIQHTAGVSLKRSRRGCVICCFSSSAETICPNPGSGKHACSCEKQTVYNGLNGTLQSCWAPCSPAMPSTCCNFSLLSCARSKYPAERDVLFLKVNLRALLYRCQRVYKYIYSVYIILDPLRLARHIPGSTSRHIVNLWQGCVTHIPVLENAVSADIIPWD